MFENTTTIFLAFFNKILPIAILVILCIELYKTIFHDSGRKNSKELLKRIETLDKNVAELRETNKKEAEDFMHHLYDLQQGIDNLYSHNDFHSEVIDKLCRDVTSMKKEYTNLFSNTDASDSLATESIDNSNDKPVAKNEPKPKKTTKKKSKKKEVEEGKENDGAQ